MLIPTLNTAKYGKPQMSGLMLSPDAPLNNIEKT